MEESRLELQSKYDVLNTLKLSELPNELQDDGKIWVKGIVKVLKCDNSRNYAIAINDGNGNPSILRDFGKMAGIVKIENIYPTLYLNMDIMPDLRKHSDIVTYLSSHDEDEEVIQYLLGSVDASGNLKSDEAKKADKAKVKAMVISNAIKDYLLVINERETFGRYGKE